MFHFRQKFDFHFLFQSIILLSFLRLLKKNEPPKWWSHFDYSEEVCDSDDGRIKYKKVWQSEKNQVKVFKLRPEKNPGF